MLNSNISFNEIDVFFIEIFRNKNFLDDINKGCISEELIDKLFDKNKLFDKKIIDDWNKLKYKSSDNSLFNFILKYSLEGYDNNFHFLIDSISKKMNSHLLWLHNWNDEYIFFKKESSLNIEKNLKKLNILIKRDKDKNKKEIENQRLEDISSGIFDPNEAQSRSIFFSLRIEYSKETIKLQNYLMYLFKQYISFIYLKYEELLFISYSLIEIKNPKELLFLNKKFQSLEKLRINKKLYSDLYEISINLNKFANHYKHQEEMPEGTLENFYNEFIFLLDNVSKFIFNKLNGTKKFILKVKELNDEIEDIYNPLGLTGFE